MNVLLAILWRPLSALLVLACLTSAPPSLAATAADDGDLLRPWIGNYEGKDGVLRIVAGPRGTLLLGYYSIQEGCAFDAFVRPDVLARQDGDWGLYGQITKGGINFARKSSDKCAFSGMYNRVTEFSKMPPRQLDWGIEGALESTCREVQQGHSEGRYLEDDRDLNDPDSQIRDEDLSRKELDAVDYRGKVLSGVDLRFTSLVGADLSEAVICDSDLSGSQLMGA